MNLLKQECYESYHPSDFREIGYILHIVKYNIRFGESLFHTNTVESYGFSRILIKIYIIRELERLTKDFIIVTMNMRTNLEKKF